MKVFLNSENCIGCGQCEACCDKVFKIEDDGVAHTQLTDVPKELEDDVQLACDGCPTCAIEVEESSNIIDFKASENTDKAA